MVQHFKLQECTPYPGESYKEAAANQCLPPQSYIKGIVRDFYLNQLSRKEKMVSDHHVGRAVTSFSSPLVVVCEVSNRILLRLPLFLTT